MSFRDFSDVGKVVLASYRRSRFDCKFRKYIAGSVRERTSKGFRKTSFQVFECRFNHFAGFISSSQETQIITNNKVNRFPSNYLDIQNSPSSVLNIIYCSYKKCGWKRNKTSMVLLKNQINLDDKSVFFGRKTLKTAILYFTNAKQSIISKSIQFRSTMESILRVFKIAPVTSRQEQIWYHSYISYFTICLCGFNSITCAGKYCWKLYKIFKYGKPRFSLMKSIFVKNMSK